MIIRVPVALTHSSLPSPAMNVWHCRADNADLGNSWSENLAEALDALEAFYSATSSWHPTGTVATFGDTCITDPLGEPGYGPSDPRTVTTGTTTNPAPVLLAAVVSWRSAAATRSGRGRTFFGPVSMDALQSDGTPKAELLSDVGGAAATLIADSMSANGWAFGVLSTKDALLRDITGYRMRDRWAYLSSRRD